jgi:hypothetical protein
MREGKERNGPRQRAWVEHLLRASMAETAEARIGDEVKR